MLPQRCGLFINRTFVNIQKTIFLSVCLKIRTIRACEVTTLWGYTNMFIIVVVVIIIILFILLLFF